MTSQEPPIERLAQLELENHKLKQQQDELRRLVLKLMDQHAAITENMDRRIAQAQFRSNQAFQQAHSILNSRIWKSLVGLGGAALNVAGLAHRIRGRRPTARPAGWEKMVVFCDEPAPSETVAVSGIITVRGWAVAESGLQRIEILPPAGDPLEVKFGLYRPDVAVKFPHMADADASGFVARFDTLSLPSGPTVLRIRAVSKSGAVQETELPLGIDHLNGFSSPYARWIKEFEQRNPDLIALKLQSFDRQPVYSILTPVYRTNPAILEKTIESVLAQSYPHWELCLVDDGSQSESVDRVLREYEQKDQRIRVQRRSVNGGISAASNDALNCATGDFVVLLDHDDQLAVDALFHVTEALQHAPDAGILYSDEDHIDENGHRFDPFFKPDWDPDLILSENYVCHLMVFRRELGLAVGGFRSESDVSQDHDILLRMSLRANRIVHIPKILYHWRTEVENNQRASTNESRAIASSREAIEFFLRESGSSGTVEASPVPGRWRMRYPIAPGLRLSILIPSGGKVDVLETNLRTLLSGNIPLEYEIVIIDNSKDDRIREFVERMRRRHPCLRSVDLRHLPFNYSKLNNIAAAECQSDLLLFLNDDTSLIEPDSITAMAELAARPEVGAVGAKLLYPDGRIQHAGIVMGVLGVCGHAFKGCFANERRYFDFPDVIRNVSAVTGACLMTRASVFREVGGFDEQQFPVAYNDVDLCLKIGNCGYRILYTPHALLTHYEAFSKTPADLDPRPAERDALLRKWNSVIESDPFYSPNLSRTDEEYSLRRKDLESALPQLHERMR